MASLAASIRIGATVAPSVGNAFRRVEQQSHRLGKTVGNTARLQTVQAGRAMQSGLQGQFIGTVAPALALGAPIQKAIEFESTLAEINKVVDFKTDSGLEKMGQAILALSTDGRIPLVASEIGSIVAAAGQAGIASGELLQFTQDAAKIGVAFDLTGKQAGSAMTGLRSIFELNQKEAVLVADAFNHLSNNMDATARGILNVTNRVGSMGAMVGLSGQQVGALAATFIALKTPPEIAATGMKALIQNLATADQGNQKFQEGLASLGFTAKGMKRAMEKDAQGTLIKFLETVKGSKDQLGTLSLLFGREYSDDIAKLVGSLDTYKKSLGLIADQTTFAGSAQKEYEARAKTTENNLQLLGNQTQRVAINLGNTLLPAVNVVVNALSQGISIINTVIVKNQGLAKVVFTVVGALIAYQTGVMAARLATLAFGRSMLTFGSLLSPIGLVIAALVVGGILIQRHWAKLGAFFEGFAKGFNTTIGPALTPVVAVVMRAATAFGRFFQPIGQSAEALDQTRSAGERFGIMLGGVVNRLLAIPGLLGNLAGQVAANPFFQSGVAILTTLAGGIRAGARVVIEAFSGVLSRLRAYLPFSDAKIGPLSQLTASGRAIITTLATGIRQRARALLAPLRPIANRVARFLGPTLTRRLKAGLTTLAPLITPLRLAFAKLRPILAKIAPLLKTGLVWGLRTLGVVVRPVIALMQLLAGGLGVLGGGLTTLGGGVTLLSSLLTPFALKLGLLGGAVWVLVRFRKELGAFFTGFKAGFMGAFGPALQRIQPIIQQLSQILKPVTNRFAAFFSIFSRDETTRLKAFAAVGKQVGAFFGIIAGGLTDFVGWMIKSHREIQRFGVAAGKAAFEQIAKTLAFLAAVFKNLWGAAKGVYETMFTGAGAFRDAETAGRTFGRALVIALPIMFGVGILARRLGPLITAVGTAFRITKVIIQGSITGYKGAVTWLRNLGIQAKIAKVQMLGLSAVSKVRTAWTFLSTLSFGGLIAGIKGLGVALLANPIGLIMAGIAVAALLIYKFWTPIKAFMAGLWTGIKSVFQDGNGALNETFASIFKALEPVVTVFKWLVAAVRTAVTWFANLFQPVKTSAEGLQHVSRMGQHIGTVIGFLIKASLTPFIATFRVLSAVVSGGITIFDGIKTAITTAIEWLKNINLFTIGKALLGTLSSGIKAAGGSLFSIVKGVLGRVGRLFPQSDAREGPMSRLTASGRALVTTFGEGVASSSPGAVANPLKRHMAAATAGLALASPTAALAGDLPTARSPLRGLTSDVTQAGPRTAGGDVHITNHIEIQVVAQPGEPAKDVIDQLETRIDDLMRRVSHRAAVQLRGGLHDGDHVGVG